MALMDMQLSPRLAEAEWNQRHLTSWRKAKKTKKKAPDRAAELRVQLAPSGYGGGT